MVLFYKTNKYEGKLSSSNEGEVYWMEIDDMKKANLADGMEKMLEVFLKELIQKNYQCHIPIQTGIAYYIC